MLSKLIKTYHGTHFLGAVFYSGTAPGKGEKVEAVLLQTYTVALPVILGYIVWILKRQKRDRDANSTGTMLLLRVQLIDYHDKYMKLGSIPSYAYENFVEMYEAYHELGGNGMVTKMYKEIQDLHLADKKGEQL